MNVEFTAEQQPFVRHAIESGRIHRPEDVLEEALCLWVERERAAQNFGNRVFNKTRAHAAAARMREQRKRHILPPGVTIRSIIDEGRD